jgi:hypothetical protein
MTTAQNQLSFWIAAQRRDPESESCLQSLDTGVRRYDEFSSGRPSAICAKKVNKSLIAHPSFLFPQRRG